MQSSDNQRGREPVPGAQSSGTQDAAQTPGARSTDAWSAEGAAADFLGLDQEVSAFAGSGGLQDPAGTPAPVDGSHSWLLALEGEPTQAAAPSSQTFQATPPDRLLESELPAADAVSEEAPAVEEDAPPTEPARRRSRAPWYALAAACVLAAGGWYGWQWWQQQHASTETVATNPTPAKPTPKVAAKPPTKANPAKPTRPAPAAEPTSTASAATGTTSTEPTASTAAPAAEPRTSEPAPAFEFGPRASDDRVAGFLAAHGAANDASGLAPADGHSTLAPFALDGAGFALATENVPSESSRLLADAGDSSAIPEPEPELGPRRAPRVQPHSRSRLRHATDEDLAGVWDAGTIPMDAIEKDQRMLTPGVGRVRVTIHGGEIFEGGLYAVGQKLVWLDTDLGRMALDANQVVRMEHLSSKDGTPKLGGRGSQALAGLPRMRVRAPGGMLYGRVIGRDEKSVTLVTDTGARITIDTTEIEPAPEKRSLIVRGAEAKAPGS